MMAWEKIEELIEELKEKYKPNELCTKYPKTLETAITSEI
jgi:hypothetical protein